MNWWSLYEIPYVFWWNVMTIKWDKCCQWQCATHSLTHPGRCLSRFIRITEYLWSVQRSTHTELYSSVLLAQRHCRRSIRQPLCRIFPRRQYFVFFVVSPATACRVSTSISLGCLLYRRWRRYSCGAATQRRALNCRAVRAPCVVCGLVASRYRCALYAVNRGHPAINYCVDRQPYLPRPRQPSRPVFRSALPLPHQLNVPPHSRRLL